ncbi:D-inositol-3-phosphate glycosyltransferase [Salana multivorans]|uniref:D-inositol-3-phosphate glycosyltransferase n=1 Tax=Salana multivorans TaxID=120377 RepID=A0A3N2DAL1_9MICO|nr:glycosyltransferase [Salana multivorans]ROR96819.1 D-inositol-3-phosphate glycosyltransferase [Salana multivorans]
MAVQLAPGTRIGLVCLHTDPYAAPGSGDVGGMNVVVRQTAAAMARLGAELDVGVEVVTRLADAAAPRREVIDGVTVHRLAVGPARAVPKGEHEAFVAEFGERLAELGPFDVVHSQHWFSGAAALPVARDWGVPHLQSFHSIAAPVGESLAHGERPESPGRLAGEAMLARGSDGIIAVSHAEQATAVARLGADPSRVLVVHPGVDAELFRPRHADECGAVDEGGGRDRPRLLIAARLEPLKGVDLAIEALAELRELAAWPAGGRRPVLRVAGGATADEAFVDSLVELARRLGVADDVELLGPRNRVELAEEMRAATLVLVPSHFETYGLVALEASASGVPVLASDAGGLRESVIDGETGVLLATRSPRAWAEAVGGLLADRELREQLGAAGRRLALGRSWTGAARLTLAAYAEAIAPAPR